MKVTILGSGTSQGIPVIGCSCAACRSTDPRDNRLRCSILIEVDGLKLLVDTSPDLRQQMLTHKVDKIDAVLYTHEHNDHTAGLDDLRPYNFMQGGDMPIYGLGRVIENLESRFSYAFDGGAYPGVPRMKSTVIDGDVDVEIEHVSITPIRAMHGSLPVLGYRIDGFVYLTDVSSIVEVDMHKLENADVLVIDALQKEPHHSHMSLGEALQLIQQVKPGKAYLTHISHVMGAVHTWENEIPDYVESAYDGMIIWLN